MNLKELRDVGRRADNVGVVRQVRAVAANDTRRGPKDYLFYLVVGGLGCATLLFVVSILTSLAARLL